MSTCIAALLALTAVLLPEVARAASFHGAEPRAFVLNDTHSENLQPKVAYATDGSSVVVWDRWLDDGSQGGIVAQRFDAAGSPLGAPFQVNETQEGWQQDPAIAMAPTGAFVIAWSSIVPPTAKTFLRRYRADGTPMGGEVDVEPGDSGASLPTVTIDSAGRVAVAWFSLAGLSLRRFSWRGTPVGALVRMPAADVPALAPLPGGGYWLVWRTYTASEHVKLYARRFDAAGRGIGQTLLLNRLFVPHQGLPVVAAGPAGELAAAWSSCDFTRPEIGCQLYLRRVTADGEANAREQRISPDNERAHDHPALAFSRGGELGAAWQNCRLDAGGQAFDCGIRARFFDASGAPAGPASNVRSPQTLADPFLAAFDGGFRLLYDTLTCDAVGCDFSAPTGIYSVDFLSD